MNSVNITQVVTEVVEKAKEITAIRTESTDTCALLNLKHCLPIDPPPASTELSNADADDLG